jgi:hypothetical protein
MRKNLLALFALIILIGISLALSVFYGYYLREYRTIPFDFHIETGKLVGLNANADALHFGTMPPGSSSRRNVTVTAVADSRLVFRFSGNGSAYLRVNPSELILTKGVPMNISFFLSTPDTLPDGNYSGIVKFYFFRR